MIVDSDNAKFNEFSEFEILNIGILLCLFNNRIIYYNYYICNFNFKKSFIKLYVFILKKYLLATEYYCVVSCGNASLGYASNKLINSTILVKF